ncbi:MAG: oligosaccharide flippase family protein [Xenophilus sp.]
MAHEQRSLAARVAGAGAWTVGTRLAAKLIDLAMLVCLARFLGPADFGLVAMAMAVVYIVEALLEMPLGIVLLREPGLEAPMLDTAFTLGVLRGLAIAVLLLVLAWPLAWFNGEPRLAALLAVLALAPAARSMSSPRMIEYTRALKFRPDAMVELSGKAVAFAVSVALAAAARSHWAIAAATVCAPLVGSAVSYAIAPFRPRLTLCEWRRFSHMLGWNFVSQFCVALSWQIDRLLLPRFTPMAAFGRYTMAKQLSEIPIQALATPLMRPAMAALAAAGPDIRARYLQFLRAILLVMIPVMAVPALWPQPLIRVALGPAWLPAAQWLQWICAVGLLSLPTLLVGALAQILDRTHWAAVRTVIELAVRLPLVWWGAAHHGIPGAVAASAVVSLLNLIVSLHIVRRLVGAGFGEQLRALWIPVAAATPAGAVLWAAQPVVMGAAGVAGLVARAVAFAALCALAYGLFVFAAWRLAGRPAGFERYAFERLAARLAFLWHGHAPPQPGSPAP